MVDWESWQATSDAIVADKRVWIGLLNENWEPIATLSPRGVNEAYTRLASPELSFDHDGMADGGVSTIVDELIAPDLGKFDEQGRFEASNIIGRNVCVYRGDTRQAYFIPYVDAEGNKMPESLHIESSGLMSLLDAHPCPSVPESWRGGFETRTANAAGPYKKPREYSLIEMATRADGYTVAGTAEYAIRTVVQDSLDAVRSHMGWERPHMVVDFAPSGVESPDAMIRVEDDFILSTIEETARTAGVSLSADLWWPGDEPVITRVAPQSDETVSKSWDHAIAVIRIRQMSTPE